MVDFSIIRGMFAGAEKVAQASRNTLANTQGALAPQRALAKALSTPSHPNAGRLLAESGSDDIPTLFSTRGSAAPFSNGLKAAANRTLAS